MEIFSNIEFNESTEVLENTIDTLVATEFTEKEFINFSGIASDEINEDQTLKSWIQILIEELNSVIFQRTGDYYILFR